MLKKRLKRVNIRKSQLSVLIVLGGVLVAAGVFAVSNLDAQNYIATNAGIRWTENAGSGIGVPACSSASPGLTCSGGAPSVTLSWNYGGQHGPCGWADVSIAGGPSWNSQSCSGSSPSWNGGASNTTYSYSINYWFDPQPHTECQGETCDIVDPPPVQIDSNSDTFTTNNCAPLTVSCSPNKTTASTGEQVTWTASPEGGSGTYTSFTWAGSDPLGGKTGNPVTVQYSTPGAKNGTVTVTDSAGATATDTCNNSVSVNPGIGAIHGFKVKMPGNQNVTPPGAETVKLDGGSPTTANPYFFTNISAGQHTVSVTVPSGWSAGYTVCYSTQQGCGGAGDPAGYHSVTPISGSSASVNVPAGGFADLWWHFSDTGGQINDSSCGAISVPASVVAGQSFSATVTMNNNGTKPWTDPNYDLIPVTSPGVWAPTLWGIGGVDLPFSPVNQNQSAPFSFNAAAPSTPNTYDFSWQMIEQNVGSFGPVCTKPITVVSSQPTLVINPPSVTLGVNQTASLTAIYDPDGPSGSQGEQIVTTSASWLSNNPAIAAVNNTSNKGLVTANAPGTTIVSAAYNGLTATANIAVTSAPQPFGYDLANTGDIVVSPGESGNTTIDLTLVSGDTQQVSLSKSGLPAGVTGTFGTASCSPTCSSTFTIGTQGTTATGIYPITITGSSVGVGDETTTFDLIVTTQTDPHFVCQANACVSVPGLGDTLCFAQGDCAPTCDDPDAANFGDPLPCTYSPHFECQAQACVSVPGADVNQCSDDLDCGGGCSPGETSPHTECSQSGSCVSVPGCGISSCANNFECSLPPPPTVSILANNTDGAIILSEPANYIISWTSASADSCSAFGSWSGGKSLSGSEMFSGVSAGIYTYGLFCTNAGGSASDSVRVNIFHIRETNP